MKTMKNLLIVVLFFAGTTIFGQKQQTPKGEFAFLPNLTKEQSDKIHQLHLDFIKNTTNLRNDLSIAENELDKLFVNNAPMKEKEAKIRQISDLKVKIAIEKAKYFTEVRNLLNDEQKTVFDAWLSKHNTWEGMCRGLGNGCNQDLNTKCCKGPNNCYKNDR